jgi:hypothetical protein
MDKNIFMTAPPTPFGTWSSPVPTETPMRAAEQPNAFGTLSSPVPNTTSSPNTGVKGFDWGSGLKDLGSLFQTGLGLWGDYKNYQNMGNVSNAYGFYNDQNKYYAGKLKELIDKPDTIKSNPAYAAGLNASEEAIRRQGAKGGMLGSGNLLLDLGKNAQDYQYNFYNQEANRLASLANPNLQAMAGQNAANQAQNGILMNGIPKATSSLDKFGNTLSSIGSIANTASNIAKLFF